ncbi:MAG: T9SS type A sorting domain-containing protein [Bacteroidetes bacterium]|nr:T9SS type A sorting domain-containing protein [Bacteroidota bacterium]
MQIFAKLKPADLKRTSQEIIDLSGKRIYNGYLFNRSKGSHSISLETENWSSGIYFYSISTEYCKAFKKMIVLKE